MRRMRAALLASAAGLVLTGAAQAQEPGRYGARVGNAYLPSSHDSNCVGIICSSLPTEPGNPSKVVTPPPCEGLLCSMTPYGMQRPYTASDAAAAEKARAAALAQAAAQPPAEPVAPTRHSRKVRKAKVARTPAPAEAAAGQ